MLEDKARMIRKGNFAKLFLLMAIVLLITSCSDSSEQDVVRSTRVSNISNPSEINTEQTAQTCVFELTETNPSFVKWRGDPKYEPSEYDFDLDYCDDVYVVDYGQKTVNVYQASYSNSSPLWGEDWLVYGFGEIKDWCTGWPISSDGKKYYVQERDKSIKNIRSVELLKLSEIEGYKTIAQRLGIEEESPILCWTYSIDGFPDKIFSDLSYFKAPTDLNSIRYTRISAQYVDGLPVYARDSNWNCCSYEWPNVLKPARLSDVYKEGFHINPSQTCILDIERGKYVVTDTIMEDISITDPKRCLPEIKKALMYDPSAVTQASVDNQKEPLKHIWEKIVRVYCMELAYVALDSTPRYYDVSGKSEPDADRINHDIKLVPVWEVYYYITNPKNETTVADGMIMINAVTGKSLYSDTYGPNENVFLYPELEEYG